jgi:hypothetical protein
MRVIFILFFLFQYTLTKVTKNNKISNTPTKNKQPNDKER